MGTYRRINVASGRPLETLAHYSRALRVGDMVLQSAPPAFRNRPQRGPRTGNPLALYLPPSRSACPNRAKPCHACLRTAVEMPEAAARLLCKKLCGEFLSTPRSKRRRSNLRCNLDSYIPASWETPPYRTSRLRPRCSLPSAHGPLPRDRGLGVY
jgi:hypothetical protein